MIFASPTLAALGVNVYNGHGECARKLNLSVQGVESLEMLAGEHRGGGPAAAWPRCAGAAR